MDDEKDYLQLVQDGYDVGTFDEYKRAKYGTEDDDTNQDTSAEAKSVTPKVETPAATTTDATGTEVKKVTPVESANTEKTDNVTTPVDQSAQTQAGTTNTDNNQIDDNLQYTYGGRTLTGAELKQHQKEMTDKYGEGYKEYEWGKAVSKADYDKHMSNVQKYGEDYVTTTDGRVMSRGDYNKLLAQQQQAAKAQASSKPTAKAQVKSIEHAEVKDGKTIHYYIEGGKNVYNPDDVAAWEQATHRSNSTLDQLKGLGGNRQFQATGASAVPIASFNGGKLAASGAAYKQTVEGLQKAENRRVWALNNKAGAIAQQQGIQEQANVLRDALGNSNFMQQYADQGADTLDGNMMPTRMRDEGPVTVQNAEGEVGLADAYGNQYFDEEKDGRVITAQQKYDAAQESLHSQRQAEAQWGRDENEREDEYRRTHNRPETEPVKAEGESDDDYYQRMKWWYDDKLAEYDRQADEAMNAGIDMDNIRGNAYGHDLMIGSYLNQRYGGSSAYSDIIAKRDAFKQDMEQNHPELFARNWEAICQETVGLIDNIAAVEHTALATIGDATGAHGLSDFSNERLDEIQERKNNAKEVAGFVGKTAQTAHNFGLTLLGTAATALGHPEVGGMLIKTDLYRMITEGAGGQMVEARDHGASNAAALGAGAANAAVWALVGKLVGTPFSRQINNITSQVVGEETLNAVKGLSANDQKLVVKGVNDIVDWFVKEGGNRAAIMDGVKGFAYQYLRTLPVEVSKTTVDMTTANTITSLLIPLVTIGDDRSATGLMFGDNKELNQSWNNLKNALGNIPETAIENAKDAFVMGMWFHGTGMISRGVTKLREEGTFSEWKEDLLDSRNERNGKPAKSYNFAYTSNGYPVRVLEEGVEKEFDVKDKDGKVVMDENGKPKKVKVKCAKVQMTNGAYTYVAESSIVRKVSITRERYRQMAEQSQEAWRESQREIGENVEAGQDRAKAIVEYRQANSKLQKEEKNFSEEEKNALNGDVNSALVNGVFTPEHEQTVREYLDAKDKFDGMLLGVEHEQEKILSQFNQIVYGQAKLEKQFDEQQKKAEDSNKPKSKRKNKRKGYVMDMERDRQSKGIKKTVIGGTMSIDGEARKVYVVDGNTEGNGVVQALDVEAGKSYQTSMDKLSDVQAYDYDALVAPLLQERSESLTNDIKGIVNRDVLDGKPVTLVIDGMPKTCKVIGYHGTVDGNNNSGIQYEVVVDGETNHAFMTRGDLDYSYKQGLILYTTPNGVMRSYMHSNTTEVGSDMKHYANPEQGNRKASEMPTVIEDENGNPMYEMSGVEATVNEFNQTGIKGNDAARICDNNIANVRSVADALEVKRESLKADEPTAEKINATSPRELKAAHDEWQAKMDQYEAQLNKLHTTEDFWNAVKGVYDNPIRLNQVTEEIPEGEYGFVLNGQSIGEVAKTLNVPERELTRLDKIAKDLHKHIVVKDVIRTIDDRTANGLATRNDIILISKDTIDKGMGASFILGHEITHTFGEDQLAEFIASVKDAMGEEFNKQFKDIKEKYAGLYNDGSVDADIEEEVACDFAGRMLSGKNLEKASGMPLGTLESWKNSLLDLYRSKYGTSETETGLDEATQKKVDAAFEKWSDIVHKRASELESKNPASVSDAAAIDSKSMNVAKSDKFNINTESGLHALIQDYAKSADAKRLGWMEDQIDDIVKETSGLLDMIHSVMNGDKNYDEFAKKDPTIVVDWRDGQAKPTVTWARNNIEYKYDMSADTFCINNEGLETVLASPVMADLMVHISKHAQYTSDDYLMLYETLRDMGFVVPCKGCFDAAARLKMLPSVAQKFVQLVNETIDERNADPEKFDASVRAMEGGKTENGLPAKATTKEAAVRIGVAGDRLTEHLDWTQLMSAEGQTKALADWGGIFRAWQHTGAGRPKDKLMPEPYTGQITTSVSTIIAPYGEKTPSFRDLEVNQGTGLRRNSHSEFRPVLAVDEIQFMRDAWIRHLRVFKYMKELDDVRLFGRMGVKFNMSGFPAWVKGGVAAGLDADGNYAMAEESVGGREFPYDGEDGKTHYDGQKGLEEAMKYINKDVSLSSVCMSVPHFIKCLTDVPTPTDKSGIWGSLIPFHASGATAHSLKVQGLGDARGVQSGTFFAEALDNYDKGVTNFEDVQNDRFGEGWVFANGKKAGKSANGHKWDFQTATAYRNEGRGVTLFSSPSAFLTMGGNEDVVKDVVRDKKGNPKTDKDGKVIMKFTVKGSFYTLDSENNEVVHPLVVDYNDKVRELGGKYAYKDAADFYINELRSIGMLPRFDFNVPADVFLKMCEEAHVDPNHPKLGWKGGDKPWSPCDAESYYSVFCDYGMTDPETGELAPHNAVLEGQHDADAFEKALPENYLDVIKAGLDRYSNRRNAEDARINEAIVEYCKRGVAAGKMDAETAASILEQHGFNPEQVEQVSAGRSDKLSIYGETGVKRLEESMNEKDRQDALSIAQEMEKEKKTALQIKKATGWERGADNKWRYEMPDGHFKNFDDFIRKAMNKTQFFFKLRDVWEDESLYEAYPELRDKDIEIISKRANYEGAFGYFIEMKPKKNEAEMRSTLVHELQHGIQKLEGFARGGNDEMSFSVLKDLADEQQEEASKLSTKIGKKFDIVAGFGKYGGRSSIKYDIEGLDKTLEGLDEYERLMKKYPEFFEGLTSGQVRDMSSYAYPIGYNEVTKRLREVYGDTEGHGELYKLNDIDGNVWHLTYRPTSIDEVQSMRDDVETVKAMTDKYVNKWKKRWKNFGFSDVEITSDGRIGYKGYKRLAGEVESRNAQGRIDWTDSERRNTLLSKTEDVARADQLFRDGDQLLSKKEYDKTHPAGSEKYSLVTPKENEDYMKAVESGDATKVADMVKAAAKKAMPDTKVVDADGNPLVVYHGSHLQEMYFKDGHPYTKSVERFNTFSENTGYFTESKIAAKNIGRNSRGMYECYLDIKNPLIIDAKGKSYDDIELSDEQKRELGISSNTTNTDRIVGEARWSGKYDGVIFKNIVEPEGGDEPITDYKPFYPNQIKSSEPVTRDDEGSVIPLSERFNPKKDDIRYSIADNKSEDLFNGLKEEFGETSNWRETGWMLPDGTQLDFSEGNNNQRVTDHRAINRVYQHDKGIGMMDGEWVYMSDFENRGPIRIKPSSKGCGIELSVKPTPDQYNKLRAIKSECTDHFIVDIVDNEYKGVTWASYGGDIPASRVIADINRYFDDGIKLPQKAVGDVKYSIADDKRENLDDFAERMYERTGHEISSDDIYNTVYDLQKLKVRNARYTGGSTSYMNGVTDGEGNVHPDVAKKHLEAFNAYNKDYEDSLKELLNAKLNKTQRDYVQSVLDGIEGQREWLRRSANGENLVWDYPTGEVPVNGEDEGEARYSVADRVSHIFDEPITDEERKRAKEIGMSGELGKGHVNDMNANSELRKIANIRLGIDGEYYPASLFHDPEETLTEIVSHAVDNGADKTLLDRLDDASRFYGEDIYTPEEIEEIKSKVPVGMRDAVDKSVEAIRNEKSVQEEIESMRRTNVAKDALELISVGKERIKNAIPESKSNKDARKEALNELYRTVAKEISKNNPDGPRGGERYSVNPDEETPLMNSDETLDQYLDRLKKHAASTVEDKNDGETISEYKSRIGSEDVESTGDKKIFGSSASDLSGTDEEIARKESSKTVRQRVRDLLNSKHVNSMNKRTLNSILRVIENTNPDNQTQSIREAERLVRHIEQKAVNEEVGKLLATKGAKVNDKKQKVGKSIDIFAQDVMTKVNEGVRDMKVTGLEEEMHELRSDNWHLRNDEEYKDKDGNIVELTQEQRDAKIKENSEKIAGLAAKAYEISKDNINKSSAQIDDDIAEIEKKMGEEDYVENEEDNKRLTALRVQRQLADAEGLLKNQIEMEKEQADCERQVRELDYVLSKKQAGSKLEEYTQKRETLIREARASQLLAASAQQGYLDAMGQAKSQLEGIIKNGRDSFREQVKEQKERRKMIIHEAMQDITGTGKDWNRMNDKERKKHEKVGFWKSLCTQGLDSFKYMCETSARNSFGTDGYLYRRYITGPEGVQHAASVYADNTRKNMERLNDKAKEIFGVDYTTMMDRNSDRRKTIIITLANESSVSTEELTKGQATYLHMLWKMADGHAKLEKMGFTDGMMLDIDAFIGSKNERMADWLQGEFLPELGEHDNEMYTEIYGTKRASIENYVPIKIDKSAVHQDNDMSEGERRTGALQVKVASHTMRTVNKKPIDLSTDAYNLMLNHADEVEDFYAYAKVRRDLTYLTSSSAFRNQMNANSAGSFDRFVEAARIAVKTSSTDIQRIDAGVAALQKALVGLNVAYRNTTAMKQTLSVPAFLGYSQSPLFWAEYAKAFGGAYVKNISGFAQAMASGMSMGALDTKLFERTAEGKRVLQGALSDTVAWCLKNVPDFYQRVTEGNAGLNGIDKETDINKRVSRIMDTILSRGMIANRTVDALTCAVGIKSIYEYKYKTECKRIEKEAERRSDDFDTKEEKRNWIKSQKVAAHNLALMEASVYYNSTQQSNQAAFLSPMQVSRGFIARQLSLYKNSPMSYARMTQTAINDIQKYMNPETRRRMYEEYAKRFGEQGYGEYESWKMAKKYCNNQVRKSAFNAFLYGFVMNHVWNVGGKGFLGYAAGMNLWQMLLGIGGLDTNDDDDDKTLLEKAGQTISYLATVPFQGLPLVTIAQGAAEELSSGRGLDFSLIAPELKKIYTDVNRCAEDFGVASPEMAWMVAERAGRFVALPAQAFGNVALGTKRMIEDGFAGNHRNMVIDLMLMMNSPESNRAQVARELYAEAHKKGMSNDEFFECYAKALKYQTEDDDANWYNGETFFNGKDSWYNEQKLTPERRKKMITEIEQITRDPETKAKVKAYNDALEAAANMTNVEDIKNAFDSTNSPAIRKVFQDRMKAVIEGEAQERTVDEEYDRKRRTAQGLPATEPKPKNSDQYEKDKTGEDMYKELMMDYTISQLRPVWDKFNRLEGDEKRKYLEEHREEIKQYKKLQSMAGNISDMVDAAGRRKTQESRERVYDRMRDVRNKGLESK